MSDGDLPLAALHEAAHAVMAKALGARVTELWLTAKARGNTHVPLGSWRAHRDRAKGYAVGPLVEEKEAGRDVTDLPLAFIRVLKGMNGRDAEEWNLSSLRANESPFDLGEEALREIAPLMPAVRAVAAELLARVRAPYTIKTEQGEVDVVASIVGDDVDALVAAEIAKVPQ